jgi:hypothetical protein
MLSLPKILLLLAVIVGVVFVSNALRGRSAKAVAKDKAPPENEALDLKPCAVCGNYVSTEGSGCERDDCPIAKG